MIEHLEYIFTLENWSFWNAIQVYFVTAAWMGIPALIAILLGARKTVQYYPRFLIRCFVTLPLAFVLTLTLACWLGLVGLIIGVVCLMWDFHELLKAIG